jgi:hypothetical protein
VIDPKLILQGNPLAGWKRFVFPALERASQAIVACWIIIIAIASIFLIYFSLRVLWVMLRLTESALGGVL